MSLTTWVQRAPWYAKNITSLHPEMELQLMEAPLGVKKKEVILNPKGCEDLCRYHPRSNGLLLCKNHDNIAASNVVVAIGNYYRNCNMKEFKIQKSIGTCNVAILGRSRQTAPRLSNGSNINAFPDALRRVP